MNQRQRKQVKTPNLTVQRTIVGVEENVHAQALAALQSECEQHSETIQKHRALQAHMMDATDTINDLQEQLTEKSRAQIALYVASAGVGLAIGIAVGAGRILVGLM